MNEQEEKKPGCLWRLIKTIVKWFLIIFAISYVAALVDELDEGSGQNILPDSYINRQEYLPNIPSDLKDHPTLRYRGKGDCKELEGNIVILTLFVSDPYSDWTEEQKQSVMTDQTLGIANILDQAAHYGVELNIQPLYMDVYAPNQTEVPRTKGINMNAYSRQVLSAAGLPNESRLIEALKEEYDADEATVMYYTDTVGTSEAFIQVSETGYEHTFMFRDTAAFQHELFHVFGAYDLYSPPELKQAAKDTFGDTVMVSSSDPRTDPLTAYLIGWTDQPDTDALHFLYATDHLTSADYNAAKAARPWDGYGVSQQDNGTYSGEFYNGLRHGQGTYEWNDGNKYVGQWEAGERTGYGTFTWADGAKYVGYFLKGKLNGYGTLYYSDGAVYEGNFENGNRSGYGRMKWASGNYYEGHWLEGQCHGYGTYIWTNGTRYQGDFVKGNKHGYGSMKWTDGQSYQGHFDNDQRHGQGTYKWPNGDRYEGNWTKGERTGYGTYYWKNGKYTSGYWVNGKKQ